MNSENHRSAQAHNNDATHRLAGGDLEDLRGEADGALDAELLVLRTVDEVRRDWART